MAQNTSATPSQPGFWTVREFGGPDVLRWNNFSSLPVPPADAARVRILVAGISGADNIMRAGGYTRVPQTAKPGFTPGYDLVGVIEAIGEGSAERGFKIGDTVVTMSVVGAYATHTISPLDELIKIRPDDDLVKVGALPLNYMTAYGMIARSAFPITTSTESILIGSVAGGVGIAVAQLTRLIYPTVKIFGTCSSSKIETMKSLGIIAIDRTLPPKEISWRIRELSDGGVDIAYEATGSVENLEAWVAATKDGVGKVIAIGFMANIREDGTGTIPQSSHADPIAFAAARPERMSFFSVTNHYWRGRREDFFRDFEDVLLKAVRKGELNPKIGGLWKLKDAIKINEMLVSGDGVVGKLEMLVDPGLWEEFSSLYPRQYTIREEVG